MSVAGVSTRSSDDVRHKWSSLPFQAKKKASAFSREARKTRSGDNPAEPPTEDQEKILAVMHNDAVYGIPGGCTSSTPSPSPAVEKRKRLPTIVDTPPPKKRNDAEVMINLQTETNDMLRKIAESLQSLPKIADGLEK